MVIMGRGRDIRNLLVAQIAFWLTSILQQWELDLLSSQKCTKSSLAILRQMYGKELLPVIIPENTDLRNAHFNKQDIFGYNPQAKGAVAYDKLINELFL